ncbi:hypothetical protein CEXT_518651 [Caerostris extrusa]|uniref:Uncharacterized protein n=1 Tax=Caerostris extrusa TaxID=172846 RepID=A0AAV4TYX9_CAEEX|nr:hypothetical protein CEXT_518651 [Caerostris extrusa]
MHMANPPAFYLSQLPSLPIPHVVKAKISFSPSQLLEDDKELESFTYKVENTGKILSSVGLTNGPRKR